MIESASDKSTRILQIVEAAQKLFGMYGIEKTSMREIAAELGYSKASLYYYFPDKESLYKAVVEKEQEEFINNVTEGIRNVHDPENSLHKFAKSRLSYFKTLLNISRLKLEAYSDIKPVLRDTIQQFREKEKEIIAGILESGLSKGIFFIRDTDATASLYLDLLKGLRISVMNEKRTLIIEQDEYERLLEKTMSFTDMFIKGLKYNG